MKGDYRLKSIGVAVLALPFATASFAGVVLDGSADGSGTQSTVAVVNSTYEITQNMGSTSANGANLFHSFDSFTVEEGLTANFSGADTINNIIGRVTGGSRSDIFGTLSSSIPGANLYLLNPNGIMFGANASINITGSFYASTANTLTDTNGETLSTDINAGLTLLSAAPSEFGFTTDTPAGIDVIGSTLSVNEGKTLSLIGGDITLTNSTLSTESGAIILVSAASEGTVTVTANEVDTQGVTELGNINMSSNTNVSTTGSDGGAVVIRGNKLVVDNSVIAANVQGVFNMNTRPGVDIGIDNDLTLDNNSYITTNVEENAFANSSGISIAAANIRVNNQSSIQSITQASSIGNSGDIVINASTSIDLDNGSAVSTQTSGFGDSGDITVSSEKINIKNASYISTAALYDLSTGQINGSSSGDISINSREINIIGLNNPTLDASDLFQNYTGIATSGGLLGGSSGSITLNTNDLTIQNFASIQATIFGQEPGGNIDIHAEGGQVELLNGGGIKTASEKILSPQGGSAGDITINADRLVVSGVNNELEVSSQILSTAGGSGVTGGDINLTAEQIQVLDGARIRSQAASGLASNADPGNITLQAENITVSGINQGLLDTLISKGESYASAYEAARSQIVVENTSPNIETDTFSPGQISLTASNTEVTNGALIKSINRNQTEAGNIVLNADSFLAISDSDVITSSDVSNGNGGDINLNSDIMLLNNASIKTTAINGTGGDINITANTIIKTQDTVIDASSEFFLDGEVFVSSDIDLIASLEALPSTKINVSDKFRSECESITDVDSSFTTHSGPLATQGKTDYTSSQYLFYDNNLLDSHKQVKMKQLHNNLTESEPSSKTHLLVGNSGCTKNTQN